LADFLALQFRTKTPTLHHTYGEISFKIAYFSKMTQTIDRFLKIEKTQKNLEI